jgi:hypothetical protein
VYDKLDVNIDHLSARTGANPMPLDAEIRTSLRMERSLHDHVAAAAKSNGRNFSEEVRQRLAASFPGKPGGTDAPLDKPTQELLEGFGRMAAELAETGYPPWYEDPFAFRVLAAAILKFMRLSMPKGEPVPNPKPGSLAAEGFYGKRATVDGVAAALASSARAIADHLAEVYR